MPRGLCGQSGTGGVLLRVYTVLTHACTSTCARTEQATPFIRSFCTVLSRLPRHPGQGPTGPSPPNPIGPGAATRRRKDSCRPHTQHLPPHDDDIGLSQPSTPEQAQVSPLSRDPGTDPDKIALSNNPPPCRPTVCDRCPNMRPTPGLSYSWTALLCLVTALICLLQPGGAATAMNDGRRRS